MSEVSTLPEREAEWTGESPLNPSTPDSLMMSPPPPPPPPSTATPSLPDSLSKPSLAQGDVKFRTQKDASILKAVNANYRFIYRINDGIGTTNTMLQKVCEERGWKEFKEVSLIKHGSTAYERAMRGATGWNLWWSYSIHQFNPYKYLQNWQFTNHNPKGFQFCNKLYLTMFMRKMEAVHGSPFDFYPRTFIVPEDYLQLHTEHTRRVAKSVSEYNHNNLLSEKPAYCCSTPIPATSKSSSQVNPHVFSPLYICQPSKPRSTLSRIRRSILSMEGPSTHSTAVDITKFNPVWISKPVALSKGRGIFLTTDLNQITADKRSVVQEYITRPLLIGGYKFDLRIYVVVAAVEPLVIYIYHEGLCRFCTEKYDTTDLSRTFSHLTNASLNKLNSPAYEDDKELIGQGCKWSLRHLRQYLKERNICDWVLWQKIMAMVVLTVVGDSLRLGYSASNRNCFDLFGFDVLVDENLKPWLLECNYSPGLGGDCETDEIVKVPMLHELFNLLGFPDRNTYKNSINTEETRSGDDEEVGKDDITKHYFDMLLAKYNKEDEKMTKAKWARDVAAKTESRLNDAKSIYSQSLVVQYLKNHSTANKLSKQVQDQLIAAASKKLRTQLSEIAASKGASIKKENKLQKQSVEAIADELIKENSCIDGFFSKDTEASPVPPYSELPFETNSAMTASLAKKIVQEFPAGNSDELQKLKYYFESGVDYPMDSKTGKFKGCPALISATRDWSNPPKQEGGWIRVYPFDAKTKCPYKSLTDIKQAVRSIEYYIQVAEQICRKCPNESDTFYRQKIKSLGLYHTEVWTPPSPTNLCLHRYSPGPNPGDNSDKSSILISDDGTNPVKDNNSGCPAPPPPSPRSSYCWQTSEELHTSNEQLS